MLTLHCAGFPSCRFDDRCLWIFIKRSPHISEDFINSFPDHHAETLFWSILSSDFLSDWPRGFSTHLCGGLTHLRHSWGFWFVDKKKFCALIGWIFFTHIRGGCLIEVYDWMIQKLFSFLIGLNFCLFCFLTAKVQNKRISIRSIRATSEITTALTIEESLGAI